MDYRGSAVPLASRQQPWEAGNKRIASKVRIAALPVSLRQDLDVCRSLEGGHSQRKLRLTVHVFFGTEKKILPSPLPIATAKHLHRPSPSILIDKSTARERIAPFSLSFW